MGAVHNRGRRGEAIASDYLEGQGYTILTLNYRVVGSEIDIIARDPNGTLVFVEVKTRSSEDASVLEHSFGYAKRKALKRGALTYMASLPHAVPVRFDLIFILGKTHQITHIPNALVWDY